MIDLWKNKTNMKAACAIELLDLRELTERCLFTRSATMVSGTFFGLTANLICVVRSIDTYMYFEKQKGSAVYAPRDGSG